MPIITMTDTTFRGPSGYSGYSGQVGEISGDPGKVVVIGADGNATTFDYLQVDLDNQSVVLGGYDNETNGRASLVHGSYNYAYGDESHAEGFSTDSHGWGSHSEGMFSYAHGDFSHAEGFDTETRSCASHAEGYDTKSFGKGSHSEGDNTYANFDGSHAEGNGTLTGAINSHAEGDGTKANGFFSHAEGYLTVAGNQSEYCTISGNTVYIDGNKTSQFHGSGNVNFFDLSSGADSYPRSFDTYINSAIYYNAGTNKTYFEVSYMPTYSLSASCVEVDDGHGAHAEGFFSWAKGNYSHAEGTGTYSLGESSHAEGGGNRAIGDYSHVEGYNNEAFGYASHSEGYSTKAWNYSSHTEGSYTYAYGENSHAEGHNNITSGENSHSEGRDNISGLGSRSFYTNGNTLYLGGYQGYLFSQNDWITLFDIRGNGYYGYQRDQAIVQIISTPSYAYGQTYFDISESLYSGDGVYGELTNTYIGLNSHTEGYNCQALGRHSHAEGYGSYTSKEAYGSHAEGYDARAYGVYSHAEGCSTYANGDYSHAEGLSTYADGESSHAEGSGSYANGYCSHVEGYTCTASADYSHAEGYRCYTGGIYSHAEGRSSYTYGDCSHAEGSGTRANGDFSHAEGFESYANGSYSHAEGFKCYAEGTGSHAFGFASKASFESQLAHGFTRTSDSVRRQLTTTTMTMVTSNATPTELTTNGYGPNAAPTGRFTIEDNTSYLCTITIFARQDSGVKHAAFFRRCIVQRTSGTVSLIGSVQSINTDMGSGAEGSVPAGWDVSITANDTDKYLVFTVTGEADTNITWAATIDSIEIETVVV